MLCKTHVLGRTLAGLSLSIAFRAIPWQIAKLYGIIKKRPSGEKNGASKHKKDYNIRFEKRNKS